jgi:5'-nucleotidase
MKKIFLSLLAGMSLSWAASQPLVAQNGDSDAKVITILAVNDMHAALDMFPRFAGVVDSLRKAYPNLLLFSAGDIRTGNPVNDRHDEPGWPMTHLMNLIGFDAAAVGNHEFDSRIAGFRNLINKSNFRYLCANMEAQDSLRLHVAPYRFFERAGIRIGVLGLIQTGPNGLPDTHPNNLQGVRFQPADETVKHYRWMREQCDVLVLLTHCGYEEDFNLATVFPEADIIIGGHSHTVVSNRVLRNGILMSQTGRELHNVIELGIEVSGGRVTNKSIKVINLRATTQQNAEIQRLVDEYNNSPVLFTVLATAVTPFEKTDETGALMADAQRDATQSDIVFQNNGGVRYGTHPAGDFTMQEALSLDPFGNELMIFELTGDEVAQFIVSAIEIGEDPFPSGVTYEYVKGKVKVLLPDGKPIDNRKTYRVALNSYLAAVCPFLKDRQAANTGISATDALIDYLKKQQKVDYNGVIRNTITK